MATLDFSDLFKDDEEEVVDKDTTTESKSALDFRDLFEDDGSKVEEPTRTEVTEPVAASSLNIFDDDVDTTEDVETEPAPVEETPEQILARTGEVPEGFKAVPRVPTGDQPEDYLPKLEPIDAPTPTVSDQTESAFGYEEYCRASSFDIKGVDILGC
jgi:hypothetical protein